MTARMDYYSTAELGRIITRSASLSGGRSTGGERSELAYRSAEPRGEPAPAARARFAETAQGKDHRKWRATRTESRGDERGMTTWTGHARGNRGEVRRRSGGAFQNRGGGRRATEKPSGRIRAHNPPTPPDPGRVPEAHPRGRGEPTSRSPTWASAPKRAAADPESPSEQVF